jgi:DNA invertase Pin-like site-specific DNA recombinase
VNAAAYVRVSSKAQTHDMQRHAIEQAARQRGDTIGEWYAERMSGKTLDRPELARLRADARLGKIGLLYVFKLDRLTRSGIRDTFEVVEELSAAGVKLVTVVDNFTLDGPAADVILAVMAWAAKMERLAINERISAARERLEAKGKAWGRPPRMDDAQIEKARELRAAGRTLRSIAMALGVPKSTVAVALSSKGDAKKGPLAEGGG